jgi:hypothetical protein
VVLLAAGALTLLGASALHFGLTVSISMLRMHDPFLGAAIPEGMLGVVGRVRSGGAAEALVTGLAILVVAYWPTVPSHNGRIGDVAYHFALLIDLVVALGLLVARWQTQRRTADPVCGWRH